MVYSSVAWYCNEAITASRDVDHRIAELLVLRVHDAKVDLDVFRQTHRPGGWLLP